jgi:hypothetical protein
MQYRAPHVFMKDGTFTCEHCGSRYTPALPCPINVFVAMCNGFVDDHEHCQKPEPEPKP